MTERIEYALPAKRPRRKRDPEGTREAILEAAGLVLAQDGKEGVSVAQVAQRAGVNRGTAYQHFQTREQLIEATVNWVSDKLYRATFGDPNEPHGRPDDSSGVEQLTEHIAQFAMENPEMVRVWLFEVLSSKRPADDPFWQQYFSNFDQWAQTESAQRGIDTEVASVLMLAGAFLWPIWARAHSKTAKERQVMAKRLSREMLRISLHGTLQPEHYADLAERVRNMGEQIKKERTKRTSG
jgi:AcrR family transcriptional regulator